MSKKPLEAPESHFNKVPDPRVDWTKAHKLIDLIAIAICAVICGTENWVDIELYGKSKQPWLSTFLELPKGIASRDTFGRVFAKIDAIGTQTIIEVGADYVLSVKENQGHLFEDISVLFAVDQAQDFKYATFEHEKTINKGHGRIEVRECWSTSNSEYLSLIRHAQNWAGLQSIAMVVCTRLMGDQETKHVRFYISSLASDAKQILEVVRKHWAIENELHWVLDVALNEDHSRARKDQAPENLAVIRHIALNLLKHEKTAKGGIHAKQLQAGWKEDYLLKVLAADN